jgi:hypothetical protein
MSAVAATEVARDHESWTRGYWLCHCEGYRVETSDGFVGFVEEVVRSPGASEPSALRVRTGFDGRGLVIVPVGMVREIRPEAEQIIV